MTWSSSTIYVDIDTGEKLKPLDGQNTATFIVIKTNKHVQTNFREGKGHITYTKLCRRNPQTKIDFGR